MPVCSRARLIDMSDIGFPAEGLYEDAKRILRAAFSPILRPAQRLQQRRRALATFSSEVAGHPESISQIADYFGLHESDANWAQGNGLLVSATYGELLHLWTNPEQFVTYEARLKGFIGRGGETRRVFLLGPDLADRIRLWALQRTLLRHELLGFAPRVLSVLDLQSAISYLNIDCDMFAVLNGTVGYFVKFPPAGPPLLLRTIEERLVRRAENRFQDLWRSAESFEQWYGRQRYRLPEDLLEQVELDVEAVTNVAAR